MGNFQDVAYSVFRGAVDSLSGFYLVFTISKSADINSAESHRRYTLASRHTDRRVRRITQPQLSSPKHEACSDSPLLRRLCECCLLNGGVLFSSQLLFVYALLPAVRVLVWLLFGTEAASNDTTSVWTILSVVLGWTFSTLWLVPVFFISRIINCIWFQDIADAVFRSRQPATTGFSRLGLSVLVADTMFSVFTQTLFLLQATLVSYMLPVHSISRLLYTVHLALLYSLYSFEYRWCQHGWQLDRRLFFIETHWPYFVGFGLPLALCTQIFQSYLLNGCVFSVLFPVFIVSGNEAKPVTGVCKTRIQLFTPVIVISNTILRRSIPTSAVLTTKSETKPH